MTRSRLVLALALWALPAAAASTVPLPPPADSVSTAAPAAPLIVPGRLQPADSLPRQRERAALKEYAIARELERTGHPAAAISAYRNAVRIDPDLPEAHYRMGRLFSAVSQHKPAAQEYAAELRTQPEHRPAARWLGLELAQLGDTASAIAQLRSLVRSRPDDEPSWQALGFALATAGRPAEGEQALRRALSLDPTDGDAWRDLGTVLAAQHDEVGARDAYAHALKLSPKDPGPYVNLGNLERRTQHPEAALEAYRRALVRDSTQVLAWRGQINVLIEMGRTTEAGQVYRRWLEIDPANATLREQAMEFFSNAGRLDIALELGREGVRVAPKAAESHLALGMALHESGSERAAVSELRRSQSLFVQREPAARVGALIRSLRQSAPDSLRAFFAADSVRFEAGAAGISAPAGPAAESSYVAPRR